MKTSQTATTAILESALETMGKFRKPEMRTNASGVQYRPTDIGYIARTMRDNGVPAIPAIIKSIANSKAEGFGLYAVIQTCRALMKQSTKAVHYALNAKEVAERAEQAKGQFAEIERDKAFDQFFGSANLNDEQEEVAFNLTHQLDKPVNDFESEEVDTDEVGNPLVQFSDSALIDALEKINGILESYYGVADHAANSWRDGWKPEPLGYYSSQNSSNYGTWETQLTFDDARGAILRDMAAFREQQAVATMQSFNKEIAGFDAVFE